MWKWSIALGSLVLLGCLVFAKFEIQEPDYQLEILQGRLNALIEQQESDLVAFVDQLKIYTNPFDISSDGDFRKTVHINGRLHYWSDAEIFPDYLTIKRHDDSLFFHHSPSGVHLVSKKAMREGGSLIEVFSYFPIVYDPVLKNEYLDAEYAATIFGHLPIRIGGAHKLTLKTGEELSIQILQIPTPYLDAGILLAIILLLVVGHRMLVGFIGKSLTVYFSIAWIVFGRLLVFAISGLYDGFYIFNPSHYTVGEYLPSLGDLMLHLIAAWLIIRLVFSLKRVSNEWIALVLFLVCISLTFWGYFSVLWSVLDHSQVKLDIFEDLSLDKIRGAFASLVLLVSALVFGVFERVLQGLVRLSLSRKIVMGATLLIIGAFMVGAPEPLKIALAVVLTVVLVILWMELQFKVDQINLKSLVFSLLTFVMLSLVYTTVLYFHHEKDQLIAKDKFATSLLIKNDILGELYLSEAIDRIKNDAYIRSRFFNRILTRQNIKDKIRSQFLPAYFDKYDIRIWLFDAEGLPMATHDSLATFQQLYHNARYATDYPDIFFISDGQGNEKDRYVAFVKIESLGVSLGTIVLDLSQKKYIPYTVFPKLLTESKNVLEQDGAFDYGVYFRGQLVYKLGAYEFENKLTYEDLTNPQLFEQGIVKDQQHLFGVATNQGQVFVIVSPVFPVLGLIANFSILLLALFFGFSCWFFIYRYTASVGRATLSYKIQVYLSLSFILPMLIVSIAILNTLNESNKLEIDSSFKAKAEGVTSYIAQLTTSFSKNEINKDEFVSKLHLASELVQADINVYNTSGTLLATSESQIYNLGLLSHQLNPRAFNAVKFGNQESGIFKQNIGKLVFRVSFASIRSVEDGRQIAIFTMPYFESKSHLEAQQREIFNNLISIFTLILLLAILAGNFIISKIISPLKLITKGLQNTNLEEANRPIDYVSGDEIGALVREYNTMIEKLEASKAALAESQKASAWQEIARQVAHEIKNPLTPMRLKIQQMMRQRTSDDKDFAVLNSLIAQIDTLSSIADSFSAFAKMPAPINERILLNAVVADTCELFSGDEVQLQLELEDSPCYVWMDANLVAQVLNNLLLNALQASSKGQAIVTVSLSRKGQNVILCVSDKGSGIPDSLKEKIFNPYFSTKTTGSGIGLAVAKKGIENAGGTIWFESEVDKGTSFYISLPLLD